jgi:hypothetical protein
MTNSGACFFNTIAAFALIIVIREYFINKALRAHAVLPYLGEVSPFTPPAGGLCQCYS